MILTAKAVLDGKPDASDEEIRIALGGVLCRCFTHTRMLRAIRSMPMRTGNMQSRRDFLKSGGALMVSFSAASLTVSSLSAQGQFDTHPSHIDPEKLDSWLAVGADGTVTAYTGKCDFGQGMFTAQTQLVAEELCVAISRVKLIQCDTAVCSGPGNHIRQSVDPDQLQFSESRSRGGDRPRSAFESGGTEVWGPDRPSDCGRRRDHRRGGTAASPMRNLSEAGISTLR